jgi:serine/threonine protein kinase
MHDTIGEGGFSIVRKAINENTRKTFACKIVPKKRLIQKGLAAQFEREAEILTRLRHPAVCALEEILFDTINCYAVMEYCPYGSLSARILADGRLSEALAQSIFKQLLTAISYVHSQGIAHRDIKPDNVLLDASDCVKVIDFGLSNYQTEQLLSTPVGSTCFAAPECFSKTAYDGFKCDAWSCGVVLFVMLAGQFPWTCHNTQLMVDQIVGAKYYLPPNLPAGAVDLIQKILVVDTESRLTIAEMLNHPWLANVVVPVAGLEEQEDTDTYTPPPRSISMGSDGLDNSRSRVAGWGKMLIQQGRLHRVQRNGSSDYFGSRSPVRLLD